MNGNNDQQSSSNHINVKVTVAVTHDPISNATIYTPTYDKPIIRPTERNTTITFKLEQPTPDGVIVQSVAVRPEDNDQLTAPVISQSGKKVELSDANTKAGKFNLTFTFGGDGIALKTLGTQQTSESEYPEIDNAPPP